MSNRKFILVIIAIFTVFVFSQPVFAANEVCLNGVCTYDNFTDAVAAASPGDSITVIGQYLFTEDFDIDKDNLTIDCNNSQIDLLGVVSGITIDSYDNVVLRNCEIFNSTGYTLYIENNSNTELDNVTVYDATSATVFIRNGTNNHWVHDSTIHSSQTCIWVYGENGTVIEDSEIYNCSATGINYEDSDNNTVNDNTFRDMDGTALVVRNTSNTLVDNNVFYNVSYGIYLRGEGGNISGNVITNNEINVTGSRGISISYLEDLLIRNNIIYGGKYAGIKVRRVKDFLVDENTLTYESPVSGWTITDNRSNSSDNSWYSRYTDAFYAYIEIEDLSVSESATNATFRFNMYYDMLDPCAEFNYHIEDGRGNYSDDSFTGNTSGSWVLEEINITDFIGSNEVGIYFDFYNECENETHEGVYLDDFEILEDDVVVWSDDVESGNIGWELNTNPNYENVGINVYSDNRYGDTGTSFNDSYGGEISNNEIQGYLEEGIRAWGMDSIDITDNRVYEIIEDDGIDVSHTLTFSITDNIIYDITSGDCISIDYEDLVEASSGTINNNQIDGCRYDGIDLADTNSITLSNNYIQNANDWGIEIDDSLDIELYDNDLEKNKRWTSLGPSGETEIGDAEGGLRARNSTITIYNGNLLNNAYGMFTYEDGMIDWRVNENIECRNNDVIIDGSLTIEKGSRIDAHNCVITVDGEVVNNLGTRRKTIGGSGGTTYTAPTTQVFDVEGNLIAEGHFNLKKIGKGDSFSFKSKGTLHSGTIISIGTNSVVIRFSSEPQDIELQIGETKEVDLDLDGINDIVVTLNGIENGKADVTVVDLEFVEPVVAEKPIIEEPEIEAIEEPAETDDEKPEFPWIIMISIIVVFLFSCNSKWHKRK